MDSKRTVVYYPPTLRALWPRPLAHQWARQYPHLFDRDDLRLALNQPAYHFCEWFVAIHLYHRDGAFSLLEKYGYQKHPLKQGVLRRVLTDSQRARLASFRRVFGVQPPDILAFMPDQRRFWFAEAKGPGDRLSAKQRDSHAALREEFGVPVEVVGVREGS